MKREMTLQVAIVAVAVVLVLFTLMNQRRRTAIEVPDAELIDLLESAPESPNLGEIPGPGIENRDQAGTPIRETEYGPKGVPIGRRVLQDRTETAY